MTEPEKVPVATRVEIGRLANQYNFFHWSMAFPDVFVMPVDGEVPKNDQTRSSSGFDVVLGNPPWDRMKHNEAEWFAEYAPEIASAHTTALRRKFISALQARNPSLAEKFALSRQLEELPRDVADFLDQRGHFHSAFPWLVRHDCPVCKRSELFAFNRIEGSQVTYIAMETGHPHHPAKLAETMATFVREAIQAS